VRNQGTNEVIAIETRFAPSSFFVSSWILSIFGVKLLKNMNLNLVEQISDIQL
jgi:hypothetical protein